MATTRILVAIDVDSDDLATEYGGTIDTADLALSVEARLDEFYPAKDGYIVPASVVVAVLFTDEVVIPGILTAPVLQGIYEVGVEGVSE